MQAFFKTLGDTVLARWKRRNFSLPAFPEIARAALEKRPPARNVGLADLVQDFLLDDDQPVQTDSPFGEPELVVYGHPRFYIQLLFWLDGTTAVHQHEFSGAFHVMHGSSIHAHYDFEEAHSITPYLRTGLLRTRKIELLDAGRTVPITSGRQDIHSLFHLDSPSATVVVRTQHDPGTGPQFNYLPPHVAFDPHFGDTLVLRRKQLLDVLAQTQDPAYVPRVVAMIKALDFERGFSVLHHCMNDLRQVGAWDEVVRRFEKKHGPLAEGIAATLVEDARRSTIKNLRASVAEPEHRFFLALLMNAPTRADLLALVAGRYPNEMPADVVIRWAEELTDVSDEGVTILDAVFPESMDVPVDEQYGLFLAAMQSIIAPDKKLPPSLRGMPAAQVQALRAAFVDSSLGLLTA